MEFNTDVLIIGTGVAGLYAALNMDSKIKVLLISKTKNIEGNTYLAQGGISVARGVEDIEAFIEDTMKAGRYENDKKAVKVLAKESIKNINKLIKFGVNFDRDENGLLYTREGAHRINRIVHCKDRTGREVEEVLLKQVRKRDNITIIEDCFLVDVINQGGICCGGIAIKSGETYTINSKYTILATGGIGGVFKNSTNQRTLTGDGIAIALKNGIKLKNIKYIQFHPTALYENEPEEKRFLISESVRGEGGKLINVKGERFVDELYPRDVVTKYIYEEEEKTNSPYVYLDVSFMSSDYIKGRFPTIYEQCIKKGIDITKEPIPVSPVQHYFMGGIEVDLYSRTSMKNLFACGEVSCTGVHGANRLASNSLLEGLVFSKRASNIINRTIDETHLIPIENFHRDEDADYYEKENRCLVINEILKERSDIKDELTAC